jgi:hypothetical protein
VRLERALDESLAAGVDLTGLAGLIAERCLKAAPERLLPELRAPLSLRGGRFLERTPSARGQLPEHLAADLAASNETALQQPAAGTAHLGLVNLEEAAQLSTSQLPRAVERAQEVVGLRSLGDGRLRWHALESPVPEGDGCVQPPDQLLIAIYLCADIAEGLERSTQGLVVTFEDGVDQAECHSLPACRLRVEPRDPAPSRCSPARPPAVKRAGARPASPPVPVCARPLGG